MIVAKLFHLVMNQTEFCSVHNQKEKCRKDHILYNLKEDFKKIQKLLFVGAAPGKKKKLQQSAVRETPVSRTQLVARSETHRTSQHYGVEGCKRALN